METEILEANTPNHILAPLINCLTEPISIKEFRQHLQHLPTLNHNKRDDSIFGVIRYIANSLGIRLSNATACSIDESMSLVQAREKWRQATFFCRCNHTEVEQIIYGDRAFCSSCSFIIPHQRPPLKRCPGCLMQDTWDPRGLSCLACQFATVIYRNRFHDRYSKYIEQWLPTLATDSDDSTIEPPIQRPTPSHRTSTSYEELQRLRQRSLQNSFKEIRSRSSPAENLLVIENITMLQRDIRNSGNKRDINSLHSGSINSWDKSDAENINPRGSKTTKKVLFDDTTSRSSISYSLADTKDRPPLAPLDVNSIASDSRSLPSKRQQKRRNRTILMKMNKSSNSTSQKEL